MPKYFQKKTWIQKFYIYVQYEAFKIISIQVSRTKLSGTHTQFLIYKKIPNIQNLITVLKPFSIYDLISIIYDYWINTDSYVDINETFYMLVHVSNNQVINFYETCTRLMNEWVEYRHEIYHAEIYCCYYSQNKVCFKPTKTFILRKYNHFLYIKNYNFV